jgi:succinyl-CoA synthetase beta subunit
VVSTEGGMNIEEVAHDTPEKIVTFSVDPATGVMGHHGRTVAQALGLKGDLAKQAEKLFPALHRVHRQGHGLLEINPLIVMKQGRCACLDAKMSFDSNALYPSSDVVALRDTTEEDAKEIEASKYDLAYIALDGTIGCMVNGAGLAMATMDIIKLYGESPANFLDVGGGATKEKVTAAFKIITSDPNVEGHPGQHLRRHHEMRRHRRRRCRRGEGSRPQSAAGCPPRRHQCRGRQEDHQRIGLNVLPADDLDDAARRSSTP